MEDLSLEIGFQLIPLVDEKQGGQMLSRVRTLRRHLATDLGFLVPPVHIADNLRLKPREYVLSLRGSEIGRWQLEGNSLLAVSADPQARPIPGKETREPAFGVSARWIAPELEDQALASGYSVVDATTVMSMHLSELVRRHAHELLSRAETKRLLDALNESHPKLVEELVPKVLSLGEVQRVLQQLLREQVSVRDLGTILESLIEVGAINKSLPHLVEMARQALGRGLVRPLLDADGTLPVLLLDPAIEEELMGWVQGDASRLLGERTQSSGTPTLKRISDSLKRLSGEQGSTASPVLLCQSPARYFLRRWLEPAVPRLTILASPEIPPEIRVRALGTIR
jgi:flagellar biosynthesis protein FlhA